jgi:hypothetical protein
MIVFFFINHNRQLKFLTKQGGISNQTERQNRGGLLCIERGKTGGGISVNIERQNRGGGEISVNLL